MTLLSDDELLQICRNPIIRPVIEATGNLFDGDLKFEFLIPVAECRGAGSKAFGSGIEIAASPRFEPTPRALSRVFSVENLPCFITTR